MNAISSRLGDSALRKMQQSMSNPFASQQDISQKSQKTGHLRAAIHALGAVSYL